MMNMRLYVVARLQGWNFSRMRWLWRTILQQDGLASHHHGLHTTVSCCSNPAKRSAEDVRTTFLNFYHDHGHQYVHSSGIIPRKGAGTYFVNAGMNQFKSIFLGNVEPGSEMEHYKCIVNFQKCIRVGGKHNDLEAVGRDTYHHTFFEMLGSWSFGDYWKAEACEMAWKLLTQEYGIPKNYLYITYFSDPHGCQKLESDMEVKDIWRAIGVSEDHLLPGKTEDNFWDMGDTGPCGPCTEIHYDFLGRDNAAHLVNAGDPSVVELWNLVFMQYDRQKDGSLLKLPRQHVDTGMGLERLTAVLQGQQSNYDTDLFTPIFLHLHKSLKIPSYGGKFGSSDSAGLDTAYRIIADHTRMMTVAIADGLRPGRGDLDSKLREVMHRCFRQAQVLGVPPGVIGSELVPLVVQSLEKAYPEIAVNPSEITDIVNVTEDKYLDLCSVGNRLVQRAVKTSSSAKFLSGEVMWQLTQGELGHHIPFEIIKDIAAQQGIQLDLEAFQRKLHENQPPETSRPDTPDRNKICLLSSSNVQHLQRMGIPATDDSLKYDYTVGNDGYYEFNSTIGEVLAILHNGQFVNHATEGDVVGIVLDKTSMYAEDGGQSADKGILLGESSREDVKLDIEDVQSTQNYVLHSGTVRNGSVHVGDNLHISIDQEARIGCMQNHTGTHILNYSLNKVLGSVWQKGSSVLPEKFNYDFSCAKVSVTLEDIIEIEKIANDIIKKNFRVYRQTIPLNKAKNIKGLRFFSDEEYPSNVCVVSIGVPVDSLLNEDSTHLGMEHSVELCGGTHVNQSGDLESLVISSLQGGSQGTKRVTVLTGQAAEQALKNAAVLKSKFEQLKNLVKQQERSEEWEKLASLVSQALFHQSDLPRVVRDDVRIALEQLMAVDAKQDLHSTRKNQRAQNLLNVLQNENQEYQNVLVYDYTKIASKRDIMDTLLHLKYPRPMILLSPPKDRSSKSKAASKANSEFSHIVEGFSYVPDTLVEKLDVQGWAECLCNSVPSRTWLPRGGKHAKPPVRFCNIEIFVKPGTDALEKAISEAQNCAEKHLKNMFDSLSQR